MEERGKGDGKCQCTHSNTDIYLETGCKPVVFGIVPLDWFSLPLVTLFSLPLSPNSRIFLVNFFPNQLSFWFRNFARTLGVDFSYKTFALSPCRQTFSHLFVAQMFGEWRTAKLFFFWKSYLYDIRWAAIVQEIDPRATWIVQRKEDFQKRCACA